MIFLLRKLPKYLQKKKNTYFQKENKANNDFKGIDW